jgi:hypothetical protein
MALLEFWKLSQKERQRLWGPIIDPLFAVHDFEARMISNADLGL